MQFLIGFAMFILLLSVTVHSKGNKKNIPCKNWVSVKFTTKDGKKHQVDVPKLLLEKEGFCARPFKKKQEKDKG